MAFKDVNAADFTNYAQHVAILRAFFLSQLAPHGGAPAPATLGQESLSGYKIKARTAKDNAKDTAAKAGQARSKLYFIGTDADWAKGTITRVCEPVLSESLKVIHAKPRSAQVDATQSMLQLAVETAKSEDPTSI